jgi:hypothetical protein
VPYNAAVKSHDTVNALGTGDPGPINTNTTALKDLTQMLGSVWQGHGVTPLIPYPSGKTVKDFKIADEASLNYNYIAPHEPMSGYYDKSTISANLTITPQPIGITLMNNIKLFLDKTQIAQVLDTMLSEKLAQYSRSTTSGGGGGSRQMIY